jgi:hypothetical protein
MPIPEPTPEPPAPPAEKGWWQWTKDTAYDWWTWVWH